MQSTVLQDFLWIRSEKNNWETVQTNSSFENWIKGSQCACAEIESEITRFFFFLSLFFCSYYYSSRVNKTIKNKKKTLVKATYIRRIPISFFFVLFVLGNFMFFFFLAFRSLERILKAFWQFLLFPLDYGFTSLRLRVRLCACVWILILSEFWWNYGTKSFRNYLLKSFFRC